MPLKTRTNWRTGGEVAGLILGAYALARSSDNTRLIVGAAGGVGFVWSLQGDSTLTKRRVHALSRAVTYLSFLANVGEAVSVLDEMRMLQRIRLVCGFGFAAVEELRFCGHLWDGEWYACKRYELASPWGRGTAVPEEGAEGLPLDRLEYLSAGERKREILSWLKILNDEETVDAMFATVPHLVSVKFWEENLTKQQLALAVKKAEVPELTEEQRKAIALVQNGDGNLQAPVELLRAEDGLWMKDSMWAVLEQIEEVTPPERRKYRALVMTEYEKLDVEEDEDLQYREFFARVQYGEDEKYDHAKLVNALGLPQGVDAKTLYLRFPEIGLTTTQQIQKVIGDTFEKTIKNVMALASEKFAVDEFVPVSKGLGHSKLDHVLIEWRPLVMGTLGELAIGEMLMGSLISEHGIWAFAGLFWGSQRDGGFGPLFDYVFCHQFIVSTVGFVGIDVVLRRTGGLGAAVVWYGLVAAL